MDSYFRTPLSALILLLAVGAGRSTAQEPAWPASSEDFSPGDSVPTGLTLDHVYELAAERNPRIRAAWAVADASVAREPSARTLPDPFFQIGVMNLAIPGLDAGMPNSMAPAIQLMQRVPFPGKLSMSGKVAEQTSVMYNARARETWWEVRTATAMAFYEIYGVDRQLEVMGKTLRLLVDFERVAQAMYAAGTGRQSDVLRANVEVAKMEADIERMQAMREVAAARLNALLNRLADTHVSSPLYPDLPLHTPGVDTLRAWAEQSRPLLERGRAGVARSQEQVSLARRQIWPDFTIGLQYGQRANEVGTARMGSAMIGFTLPIFAGRRQLPMRDEADAMERMATAELTELRAQVDGRIGALLAQLERARVLIRLYQSEVLPQAEANVESSFSSYRVGAVDFLTLVDAQMTLNRYEQDLYVLLADYGSGVAELEMTIGRTIPVTDELVAEAQ
jgi:outer membrane protein TolC